MTPEQVVAEALKAWREAAPTKDNAEDRIIQALRTALAGPDGAAIAEGLSSEVVLVPGSFVESVRYLLGVFIEAGHIEPEDVPHLDVIHAALPTQEP